jgi:hypothetical protein
MTTTFAERQLVLRVAGALLILIACSRIVSTYRVFNQTWDEPSSVACGMEWLDQGTYDYDPKHPPLGRVASAIGLYVAGIRSAGEVNIYAEGDNLLEAGGRYWRNLALARIGVLPFFILACVVVWRWTSWIWGQRAALLALAIFSFLPPVLGHAGVAMTDIALAATLPLALFSFCLWLEQDSPRRTLMLGGCVGLAIISKLSALIFLPVCASLILTAYWLRSSDRLKIRPRARELVGALLVTILVIAAGYKFAFSPAGLENMRPAFDRIVGTSGRAHDVVYRALQIPVPAGAFLRGIDELWSHNEEGHPNYFLGQRRTNGWFYYYPVLLAVKTPIAFLLLFVAGIAFLAREANWRAWSIVASLGGMLLVGLANHVNTGIRHILPVYVMLAGIAAYGAFRLFHRGRAYAVIAAALLLWYAGESATAHPDYLAYFNEAAHAENGAFGVDSDLDWGQDLARLRDACMRHHIDSLALAYNGSANTSTFGFPPLRQLLPGTAQTGWIAISMYKLKLGLPDQPDAFSWLERFRPVETVGKSIRLYYIPPQ